MHGEYRGIGTAAIQLDKAFGANIIITVGTEEKYAFFTKLSADYAINYRKEN